jgi:hypothetical protein
VRLHDNAQGGDARRFRATHPSVVPHLAQAQVLCEALIQTKGDQIHEHRAPRSFKLF